MKTGGFRYARWLLVLGLAIAGLRAEPAFESPFTKVEVSLESSATFSTNIDGQAGGRRDLSFTEALSVDARRNRGIINVSLKLLLAATQFTDHPEENFFAPSFELAMNRPRGRLTGAFRLKANRSARPDSAVNIRAARWNYPLELSIKYAIRPGWTIESSSTFSRRRFESGPLALVNQKTFQQGLAVSRRFTSRISANLGVTQSATKAKGADASDRGLNLGVSGKVTSKITGGFSGNWTERQVDGRKYRAFTPVWSLDWELFRAHNITTSATRTFQTTATGAQTATDTYTIGMSRAITRRVTVSGGVGYGITQFLRDSESEQRTDRNLGWDAGISYNPYILRSRVSVSAAYHGSLNLSDLALARFESRVISLSLKLRL